MKNLEKLLDLAKPYSKAIAGALAAAAAWAANRYAFSLPVGFEGFIQAAVPLVFIYLAPKNQERPA